MLFVRPLVVTVALSIPLSTVYSLLVNWNSVDLGDELGIDMSLSSTASPNASPQSSEAFTKTNSNSIGIC